MTSHACRSSLRAALGQGFQGHVLQGCAGRFADAAMPPARQRLVHEAMQRDQVMAGLAARAGARL